MAAFGAKIPLHFPLINLFLFLLFFDEFGFFLPVWDLLRIFLIEFTFFLASTFNVYLKNSLEEIFFHTLLRFVVGVSNLICFEYLKIHKEIIFIKYNAMQLKLEFCFIASLP